MEAKIKVINSKKLPRPLELLARIPNVSMESTLLLKRISIQSTTMKTGVWIVIDLKASNQGTKHLITAEPGIVKCLKEIGCRHHYGLVTIDMKIFSKTKVTPVDRAYDLSLGKVEETNRS